MTALNAAPNIEDLAGYLTEDEIAEIDALLRAQAQADRYDWSLNALPYQRIPEGLYSGEYNTVAWICGRGAGKTRTVAENLNDLVRRGVSWRIGIVAPTEAIYRDVVVAQIIESAPPDFKPRYRANEKRVEWPNGAIANLCSGERPDLVRGYNWDTLVCDEVVAWRYPETYALAKAATRLGEHPITLVATTPKSTPLIWQIVRDPKTCVITASTFDNPHLPQSFLDDLKALYFGTPDWDNEVLGQLKERIDGSLWSPEILANNRVAEAPELVRVCVGVDPSVASGEGNETGIIVAGKGVDGFFYVLADYSLQATPNDWAKKAVAAYHDHLGDKLIYEANQGGTVIESLISSVDETIACKKVFASRGKQTRAEPISALYAQGKVKHVGSFDSLEQQMCQWVPGKGISPDRIDALVWVLTELSGKSREVRFY